MKIKLLAATAACALSLGLAGSAFAATVIVNDYTLETGSFGGQLGVHSDGADTAGAVSGHVNQEGSAVTFDALGTGNLSINGQGEAIIDGDPLLEALKVTFAHSWSSVTFDFESPTEQQDPDFVMSDFTLLVNGATLFSVNGSPSCTFCIVDGTGGNKFIVTAGAGVPGITTLEYHFDPAIQQAKQFRVLGVGPALPEPASWAMMIMGFGGIGAILRRRQRTLALA